MVDICKTLILCLTSLATIALVVAFYLVLSIVVIAAFLIFAFVMSIVILAENVADRISKRRTRARTRAGDSVDKETKPKASEFDSAWPMERSLQSHDPLTERVGEGRINVIDIDCEKVENR